jgi:hypothetical protein
MKNKEIRNCTVQEIQDIMTTQRMEKDQKDEGIDVSELGKGDRSLTHIERERTFRKQCAIEDGMTEEEFDRLETVRILKEGKPNQIKAMFDLNRAKFERKSYFNKLFKVVK